MHCRVCLNLSCLHYGCQRCTLAVAQHCPSPIEANLATKYTRTFNFQEIFKRAFKIYGIWPRPHTYVRIHTHLRNAVPLVWGSLRLAPIKNAHSVMLCVGWNELAWRERMFQVSFPVQSLSILPFLSPMFVRNIHMYTST